MLEISFSLEIHTKPTLPTSNVQTILHSYPIYLIMTTQFNQIIPDSQAVIRCLDKEILEILCSHATFATDELLEKAKQPHFSSLSAEIVHELFRKIRTVGDYGPSEFFDDLNNKIGRGSSGKTITEMLIDGTKVVFLQPDGKGWQKGRIKICLEFIPEEDEPLVISEKQTEAHHSPLDDIRASLIESN